MEQKKQEMQLELSPEVAEGVYSNMAVIAHSPSEFVLDFVRVMPGMPKAKIMTRVMMTPENAKRLLGALNENIRRYEMQFGEIDMNRGVVVSNTPLVQELN